MAIMWTKKIQLQLNEISRKESTVLEEIEGSMEKYEREGEALTSPGNKKFTGSSAFSR